MKACKCGKPVEAERYSFCYDCWWAQDPRNVQLEIIKVTDTYETYLTLIRDWKWHWELNEPGYFDRAFGIDSNMVHHLADILTKAEKEKDKKTFNTIERCRKILQDIEDMMEGLNEKT